MKKKIISTILAVGLTAATLFSGCGSSLSGAAATSTSAKSNSEASSSDSSDSGQVTDLNGNPVSADSEFADTVSPKGDKVLRVACECAYAPYNWTQETADVANGDKAVKIANSDGYAYGYDIKLAKALADELGWKLEVYKIDWSSIMMGLNDGTYDMVMSGMVYTDERDKSYDFSNVYYHRTIKAAVRKDSKYASYTGLSDFAGKKVSATTQAGTNFIKYKKEIPDVVMASDYETSGEAFMAVQNKTADVVVLDKTTCESALATMPDLVMLNFDSDDDFTDPAGESNDCCICFREGDTLRDTVNSAMDKLGWNDTTKMDALMDEMVKYQPSASTQ